MSSKMVLSNFRLIESSALLDEVKLLKSEGYRFSHAFAVKNDDCMEIMYSFDNDDCVENLKIEIGETEEVHSITFIYWTAFSAELDMVKEFGIKFKYVDAEHASEFYKTEEMSFSAENIRKDVELMAEEKTMQQMMYAVERISGTCGFGNSLGYCMAVEKAMGINVPQRAQYIRTALHELSRIQSHLYWLASLAELTGFDNLSMECFRVREAVLEIFDNYAGNRIMLSVCTIGGLKKDFDEKLQKKILKATDYISKAGIKLFRIFTEDGLVERRLKDIGILDAKLAEDFCVGPVARACGVARDARTDKEMTVYDNIEFKPVTSNGGDCYARCDVRLRELGQSVDIIRQILENLPEGEICVDKIEYKAGEGSVRLEQPDGQAFYYVRSTETEFLKRFSARFPEDVNMPALVKTMEGCELSDVPVLALTIEPGIKDFEW